MSIATKRLLLSATLLAGLAGAAFAEPPPPAKEGEKTYAQALVEQAMAAHKEIAGITVQAKPPKGGDAVTVASSGAATGGTALPLLDTAGHAIGTIEVAFAPGTDAATAKSVATQTRDALKRRISHAGNLLEAAQMDPRVPLDSYAQHLVDVEMARHPDILILVIHSNVPKTKENVITGSSIGRIGKKADEDDARVFDKGQTNLEVAESKDRFEVELPLLDASGVRLGALGVVYAYKDGDDKKALEAKAIKVRDELARRISNEANLVEHFPYDPAYSDATQGQALVDRTLAKHKDLLILALHVTPPGGADNIIAASTIGRIGKKADEDDMRVIETGKPNLEVNADGNRFEVETVLLDAKDRKIGAASLVFAYKKGTDKEALHRKGDAIRDEMKAAIPDLASLFKPTP